MRAIVLIASLGLGGAPQGAVSNSGIESVWPDIAPFHVDVRFGDATRADLVATVWSQKGEPAYTLECHTYEHVDPAFNYSGDFECRLVEAREASRRYSTLLADAESGSEWDTRGRFLVAELLGDCGNYPEYGRKRTFRLRNLKVSLSLRDVEVTRRMVSGDAKERLKSFAVTVDVTGDDNQSEKAMLPPFRNPLVRNRDGTFERQCNRVITR